MKLVLATVIAMIATSIMLWIVARMKEPRKGSWLLQAIVYAITCALFVASMMGLALCWVAASDHIGHWARSLI